MKRRARIAKVPLDMDTIRSLTNAVKDMAMGRYAPDILKEERERICHTCPFSKANRCTQCGCFINTKIALLNSECPIKKWPSASRNTRVHGTQEQNTTEQGDE